MEGNEADDRQTRLLGDATPMKGRAAIFAFVLLVTSCGQATPTPIVVVDRQTPDGPTVRYASGTFEPKRLDIEMGQSVTFLNDSEVGVWPASNIHPTHEIFPELDPNEAIRPGGSWTLTFNRPGFWRYHNHLDPSQTGIVVVSGDVTASKPSAPVINPEDLTFKELDASAVGLARDMFVNDSLLERSIEEFGPAATVKLLSDTAPSLGINCHQRAHTLGRMAYDLFGAAAFSLSGHECQSGGYHGATEAFFRDHGTLNLHEDIALVCGESLNPFFRHQCVHGVGHGLMAWTTYELLDSLAFCDGLGSSQDQRSCYSGVFMENVVGGLSGSMGHTTEYLSDDPHFPCDVVDDKHVADCYFYQTSHMVALFGVDFEKVANTCAEAPKGAQWLCFQSMGRDVGGTYRGQPAESIRACAFSPNAEHRLNCLDGAVQDSFWDAGGADNALAFCALLEAHTEKSRCYGTIIARAHDIYRTAFAFQAFCARVEDGYKAGCE